MEVKMIKTKEKIVLGLFLVLILGIGAVLASGLTTSKNQEKSKFDTDDNDDDEKQESAALQEQAKITKDDAVKIALASVDMNIVGEMTDVELENEDGIVVYAVEFTKDSVETDVKIDAATGKIVSSESDLTETEEDDD